MEQTITAAPQNVQLKSPLWKRILSAISVFLLFGLLYTVIYGFTTAMSYWTGQKQDLGKPDQFYLVVLWPIVMGIAVLIPPIMIIRGKRAAWVILSILFGAVASFIFGAGYLLIVEMMERTMRHG